MSPHQREVCDRLRKVGIDPMWVLREGIQLDGYLTPAWKRGDDWIIHPSDKNSIVTTLHPWRIPAQTRMGIIAAAKAYDRARSAS
jgi:hypothetical protein